MRLPRRDWLCEPAPELRGFRRALPHPADSFGGPVGTGAHQLPLKDGAHLKYFDEAGLITRQIEAGLPPLLRDKLLRTRPRARRSVRFVEVRPAGHNAEVVALAANWVWTTAHPGLLHRPRCVIDNEASVALRKWTLSPRRRLGSNYSRGGTSIPLIELLQAPFFFFLRVSGIAAYPCSTAMRF